MSKNKSYTGLCVVISILLVLAALCAAAVGVLSYLGIFFEFSEPLYLLIACCAIAGLALILWIWMMCICATLKKYAK